MTWQQRVAVERDELGVKIDALRKFIALPNSPASDLHVRLLREQLNFMEEYHNLLTLRLERFG